MVHLARVMANHFNFWRWDTLCAKVRMVVNDTVAQTVSPKYVPKVCEVLLDWLNDSSLDSADSNLVEELIHQLILADLFWT